MCLKVESKVYSKAIDDLRAELVGAQKRITALESTPIPEAKAWLSCLERITALEEWKAGVNLDMDMIDQEIDHLTPTPTCGECKKPFRRVDHEDFPCFDHPGLVVGNYEKPSWRLPESTACSAFDAIEEAS
jgi:hypothetical protein